MKPLTPDERYWYRALWPEDTSFTLHHQLHSERYKRKQARKWAKRHARRTTLGPRTNA